MKGAHDAPFFLLHYRYVGKWAVQVSGVLRSLQAKAFTTETRKHGEGQKQRLF